MSPHVHSRITLIAVIALIAGCTAAPAVTPAGSLPTPAVSTEPASASAPSAEPTSTQSGPPPTPSATPSTSGPSTSPGTETGSPPQQLIAYQTVNEGLEGVWLINRDGTGKRQIATDAAEQALLPDWSSDGKRIVYTTRGGETEPLYVYDLETEESTQLFECVDPCIGDDEPAFSPDDSEVAFIRALGPFTAQGPSDCGLWIGDVSTGEVQQITSNPGCKREVMPRWSADGTQLTYWFERLNESGELETAVFVVNADGTGRRRITDWEDRAGESDWSPDGEWIVYTTCPLWDCDAGISNLFRIHPDGTGREQLTEYTNGGIRATQPRYTPDGESIIFTLVTGSRDLALVSVEGGEIEQITHGGIYTHGNMQPVP